MCSSVQQRLGGERVSLGAEEAKLEPRARLELVVQPEDRVAALDRELDDHAARRPWERPDDAVCQRSIVRGRCDAE